MLYNSWLKWALNLSVHFRKVAVPFTEAHDSNDESFLLLERHLSGGSAVEIEEDLKDSKCLKDLEDVR
jgi:hypothetical protein